MRHMLLVGASAAGLLLAATWVSPLGALMGAAGGALAAMTAAWLVREANGWAELRREERRRRLETGTGGQP